MTLRHPVVHYLVFWKFSGFFCVTDVSTASEKESVKNKNLYDSFLCVKNRVKPKGFSQKKDCALSVQKNCQKNEGAFMCHLYVISV